MGKEEKVVDNLMFTRGKFQKTEIKELKNVRKDFRLSVLGLEKPDAALQMHSVSDAKDGLKFFSLGSSFDLIKSLKSIVNEGFQQGDAVHVNALVAAIKLAAIKCKPCRTAEKPSCTRDCMCREPESFEKETKKYKPRDTKNYCDANADDDAVDANPAIQDAMNAPLCPDAVLVAKEEAWDFLYDIPIRSRLMHEPLEKLREERKRINSLYYKPLTRFIEASELHLETFIIWAFDYDPLVKQLVAESELPGMVGAIVKILAMPGSMRYHRVRSILNLNCITMSNVNTGFWDTVRSGLKMKDRASFQKGVDKAETMDEQKTADNVLDCAVNFLDEVAALVGSDEILAETANILLRQKEADGSDLQRNIVTSSKGSAEALLLELTDPSEELIYDGISVINTINSGPSDRIMYAIFNISGYSGGGEFLDQAKKVMKQDQKNVNINQANRSKRLANMMLIAKQSMDTVRTTNTVVR
jgi:hypothetical protein